eukprot:gene19229-19113_t
MHFDRLWRGGRLATLDESRAGLGLVEDASIGCVAGRIAFVGTQLPDGWTADEVITLEGRLVTPGLIDCHTHLVFAGDRADEFEMRLRGETYETIAAAGGGIVSTVARTRAASEAQLVASALERLDRLMAEGVTAIEVKSGYGLDLDNFPAVLPQAGRRPAEQAAVVQERIGDQAQTAQRIAFPQDGAEPAGGAELDNK